MIEFNSYIAPNGDEYPFDTATRAFLSEEGLGMPPITYLTQKSPSQHGETIIGYRLNPRTIQLTIRQNACSREDYWTKRSLLLGFLKPNNQPIGSGSYGALRKKFPDGSMRDIDVVIEQGPIFQARDLTKWDEWGFTEALRFIAHDPTFYDPTEKVLTLDNLDELTESSFLIFPFSFSFILGSYTSGTDENLVYNGTWMTYPRIVITGPATNMIITNLTTLEAIELNYNISEGEVVTIDLSFGNKTVVNDSGRDLSGIISLPSNLDSFHLAPDPEATGGINEIYINSTGINESSKVEIYYKERFIGI